MTVRALNADEQLTYTALRARLSTTAPWLNAATFELVPVAADDATVDTDRWGRIYIDFDTNRDIAVLADRVADATHRWLTHTTTSRPHHLDPNDPDFPPARANPDVASRRIADAVANTTNPTAGTVNWSEWADQVRGTTPPDWQTTLGSVIRAATSHRAGNVDYTYTRPGRRQIPGVVTPARTAPSVPVTVIADISGSVTDQLGVATNEVARIAAVAGVDRTRLEVLAVDDETAWSAHWSPDLVFADRAGHGTDLRAGFDTIAQRQHRPSVIVVITDGATPWPDSPPAVATVVCVVGPPSRNIIMAGRAPVWAKVVTIDTATLDT